MNLRGAFAALLAVFLAVPAGAAVVYLKDGGQIQGTIVQRTPDYVELATAGTTVRIGADKILRIDENASAPAAPAAPAPSPYAPAPPPSYYGGRRVFQPQDWRSVRQMLSLEFGLDAPLSNVNLTGIGGGSGSNGDVGPLIGIQYLYGLDPRWSVGFDFNYFYRNGTDSQGLLPNTDANVYGNDVVMLALLKYSFLDHGRVRPYAAGGIGPGWSSTTIDVTPNPGFVWSDTSTDETRRLVEGSGWTWASALRLGVDFLMGPEVFSFEVGWTHLGEVSVGATGAGQALGLGGVSQPLDALTVAGRWGWRF